MSADEITRWAADTAHYTRDLQGASLVIRRSSFSGSTASESSLISDVSQQSSATSFSNVSFTASEQETTSDMDVGYDFTNGKDFINQWRTAQLVRSHTFSEDQNLSSITSPSDFTPVYNGPTACNGKLNLSSAHNDRTSNIYACRSSLGLASRNAGSTWDHRAALRDSQTYNAEREAWPVAAKDLANKTAQYSQKIPINQISAVRRRCATDSYVHGSQPVVPISVGTNPRRTSTSKSWSKPSLVRQQERRDDFVLNLVECATQLVAFLWPNSTHCPVVTLNFFIQETLRRSRSTYSTLQLTLYYLYLVRGKGRLSPSYASSTQNSSGLASRGMECGRRMFLAALILASKYLQDRNFSTNAWTKITNLPAQEINTNEKLFLSAMGYSLHLPLQKYNDWCSLVQGCVDFATLGLPCPWHEVLQNYTASQLCLETTSQANSPPTPIFGSAQLSSSPLFADFKHQVGFDTPIRARDGFPPPPTTQIKVEDQKLVIPVFPASQNKIPMAPPAPTLNPKLTTPQSSPWYNAGSTSAESATGHLAGLLARGGGSSSVHTETLCRPNERSVPFVNLQPSSLAGSHKAPERAANAACLATSQSNDGDVVMCTNPTEFTCSPLSVNVSEEHDSQRLRLGLRRKAVRSSVLGTISATCYFPSPLRSSMTAQLPTPPHSSASTELLDLAASFDENKDLTKASGSVRTTMALAHRVAFEAQKHGLETLTLPPMVAPKVYDSFSDCSSNAADFQMDTPATSFSDSSSSGSTNYSYLAHQAELSSSALRDTMDCSSLRLQSASLPAIAHILRCGLREHLKPLMQMQALQQLDKEETSSPERTAVDIGEAARALGSLKRCFSATDAAGGPAAKARRILSCRAGGR